MRPLPECRKQGGRPCLLPTTAGATASRVPKPRLPRNHALDQIDRPALGIRPRIATGNPASRWDRPLHRRAPPDRGTENCPEGMSLPERSRKDLALRRPSRHRTGRLVMARWRLPRQRSVESLRREEALRRRVLHRRLPDQAKEPCRLGDPRFLPRPELAPSAGADSPHRGAHSTPRRQHPRGTDHLRDSRSSPQERCREPC